MSIFIWLLLLVAGCLYVLKIDWVELIKAYRSEEGFKIRSSIIFPLIMVISMFSLFLFMVVVGASSAGELNAYLGLGSLVWFIFLFRILSKNIDSYGNFKSDNYLKKEKEL